MENRAGRSHPYDNLPYTLGLVQYCSCDYRSINRIIPIQAVPTKKE